MDTIIEKLNKYADLQATTDLINMEFDKLRDGILTPGIKAELNAIEAERSTSLDAANEGMNKIQAEIKSDVVNHGSTVKSEHIQAIFVNPRITWDTKRLDGYAAAHPEIVQFRKIGKPTVRLKWIG